MSQISRLNNIKAKSLALTLLVPVLLFGSLLGVASSSASPLGQSEDDMNKLEGLSGKEFEIEFMTMMIGHHQSAIDMSKLVPDRANHKEVKDVAQQIISAQTKEINDMTGWLQQWHNTTAMSGMMGGSSSMSMADMTKLQGLKGDDFDKEFLTMMREHHKSAVEMAKLVPDRTDRAELETLAQNIISSQNAEIQKFDGWLKAWYGADAMTGGSMTGGTSGTSGTMPPDSMQGGDTSGNLPTAGSPAGSGLLWLVMAALAASAAIFAGGMWLRRRA